MMPNNGGAEKAGEHREKPSPAKTADLPPVNSLPLSARRLDRNAFTPPDGNFFDAVGGHPVFKKLVDAFYAGVAGDPLLLDMYPEKDLEPAKERLLLFLEQYWGGPNTYSRRRGHPRLRARHAPFAITAAARDHWLNHMRAAVTFLHLPSEHESTLWSYLSKAASAMVNTT